MILADAHVHIHPCFRPTEVLGAALANFERGSASLDIPLRSDGFRGLILLAEREHDDVFAAFRKAADTHGGDIGDGWVIRSTEEDASLFVTKDGRSVLVIAGRQIATAERLEILALGTTLRFPDGEKTDRTIDTVARCGAMTVLPWGVGKWTGRRRDIVAQLVSRCDPSQLFLGDIGARPGVWRTPALLRKGEEMGFRILMGSDPLPLPSEAAKAGRFGFAVPVSPATPRPLSALRAALADPLTPLIPYAFTISLSQFLRAQWGIRRRPA